MSETNTTNPTHGALRLHTGKDGGLRISPVAGAMSLDAAFFTVKCLLEGQDIEWGMDQPGAWQDLLHMEIATITGDEWTLTDIEALLPEILDFTWIEATGNIYLVTRG